MSSLNEQDLELLETYLDGELPEGQRDGLTRRLDHDAELARGLEGLRAARATRVAAFESMEPDPRAAERFAWGVNKSLTHGDGLGTTAAPAATSVLFEDDGGDDGDSIFWRRLNGTVRLWTAAAACVVVGFLVGWATRGPDGASAPAVNPGGMIVGQGDEGGGAAMRSAGYHVAVTNEQGQVVAVQEFADPEQARQFADDLSQLQQQRRRATGGGGGAAAQPTADQF